ncbi:MAG: MurR/RpiR family transcriptional regulator [Butyricicoccus sp.]
MDKNVYAAIQSQYATFSKVGKRIADHIIADPVHITSISIQQMAAELGIAESSIIRFCKILGCTGFSEMKLLLAKYSPKSVRTIFEDLSETRQYSDHFRVCLAATSTRRACAPAA